MDDIGFGRGLRALRIRKQLTQADVARRARLSRGTIARIEQGGASRLMVATLDRVAASLGARVHCRLSWNGEALDRLLDAGHADLVERTIRFLRDHSWMAATEVSFNNYGERGTVDVLAFHPPTQVVLVVEVKTVIPDLQGALATLDRKIRLGREIARGRGWTARSVGALLVIRDQRTARRRVAEHAATLAVTFPDRGRAVRSWLSSPDADRQIRGLIFMTSDLPAVSGQRVRRRQATVRA